MVDSTIDLRKQEIQVLKENDNRICTQYINGKELERRDGYVVIHRKYRILEDGTNNLTIISARNSDNPRYIRTYRDSNGILKSVDDYAIIGRRHDIDKVDGLYKISARNPITEEAK